MVCVGEDIRYVRLYMPLVTVVAELRFDRARACGSSL